VANDKLDALRNLSTLTEKALRRAKKLEKTLLKIVVQSEPESVAEELLKAVRTGAKKLKKSAKTVGGSRGPSKKKPDAEKAAPGQTAAEEQKPAPAQKPAVEKKAAPKRPQTEETASVGRRPRKKAPAGADNASEPAASGE